MHQIDHPNPLHQPALSAVVLPFDQFDLARILLLLHAIMHNQVGVFAVIEQRLHQFPQAARRQLVASQVMVNLHNKAGNDVD